MGFIRREAQGEEAGEMPGADAGSGAGFGGKENEGPMVGGWGAEHRGLLPERLPSSGTACCSQNCSNVFCYSLKPVKPTFCFQKLRRDLCGFFLNNFYILQSGRESNPPKHTQNAYFVLRLSP